MKEVAREAGVTPATVSLVFKRSPQIPEGTRKRILKIADRLGYRKSPYISAHMTSRRKGHLPASSPVLAFVAAETKGGSGPPADFDIAEAYFEGAAERAAARGYRLQRFPLADPGPSARRLSEILHTRNVAGILVAPLPEGWTTLDLEWRRFPVVGLGFTLSEPVLNRVACDAFQAMTVAIEHGHRLGYRRMGLALTANTDARVDRRWLAAYLMEQSNLPEMESLPPLLLQRWNEQALFSWLKKRRPDLLVTPWSSWLAKRLKERGWRIPEDIGLLTLDSPSPEAPVAGVFQNRPLLGSRAVDLLAGAIERNEWGVPRFPNALVIDGVWCPGASVREATPPRKRRRAGGKARAEMARAASMRDVARQVGVHVSTVSLSLRDSPVVSEKTRKRVRKAAEEMGFSPNPFVAKLMKARREGRLPAEHPPLAFVTAFPTPDGWRRKSQIFAQYYAGARDRAAAKSFRLEEVWVPPHSAGGDEISRELRRRSVQGILLAPLPAAGTHLSLRWEWFCVVGFGFTLNTPRIHRVANDHYSAMRRAVRECYRLGYRRIGLALSAKASARVQNRWLASYLMQQRELEHIVPVEPLIARRWTKGAVARWLRDSRPEVIIASSPTVLLGWLGSLDYSVPDDIGLVGLGSPELGGPVSGPHERAELLGARAADVLIGLIERGKYGISEHPNTLLVDGIWNTGTTVRSPR